MKKFYNYLVLLLMLFATANLGAQNTFFHETFGEGDGYWIGAENTFTKYDNPSAFNVDTIDVFIRNNTQSSGYADASGENYVDMEGHYNWNGTDPKRDTLLLKVNTSAMGNVQLHFGLFNNTGWTGIRDHAVTLQYSTNGTDWTVMDKTTTAQDTFPGSSAWGWVSLTQILPSASNLRIMFINAYDNPHEYFVDDIMLTGISNDAKLSGLQVDGANIMGFSATKTYYRYYVPEGTTDVPEITATPNSPEGTVEVTPAAEIPGSTVVTVTAPDGVTQWTYTVEFLYPIVLGEETILQETFGVGYGYWLDSAKLYDSYSGSETWSSDVVRINAPETPSSGYADASGDAALAMGPYTNGSDTVTMMGINTSAYKNIHLSFGFWNNTGWNGIRNHTFNASYSTDGENWTTIDKNWTVAPDTFPANNVWAWVTLAEELPSAENLEIHLWNPDVNHSWIMDDITFTGDLRSTDASLSNIKINGEDLSGFDAATMSYDVAIPGGELPTVEAVVTDPGATTEIALPEAIPGTATITVTAEDGTTTEQYTLNLMFTDDATLSAIMVNGTELSGFDPATTTYEVQIPGGAVPTIDATVNDAAASTEVQLPDAVPGTATVTVTAGDGTTVEVYTLNLIFATSVEKYANFARIYPNPASDVIRISAVKNMNSVEILSVTGKVLMRTELNGTRNADLNVSSLSKGLYIIRMTDADAEIHISRIVKK